MHLLHWRLRPLMTAFWSTNSLTTSCQWCCLLMASQSEYVTTQFSDSNSQTKCAEVCDFRWLIGCAGCLILKFCFRFKLYWKFLYEIHASVIETSSQGLLNMKHRTGIHCTMTSGIWLHSGKYWLTLLSCCVALNLSVIRMHSLRCQCPLE